jgi:1-acyl-sn-glycerol-3-phosphate acyltransferase
VADAAPHGWSRVRDFVLRGLQLAAGPGVRGLFRTRRQGHELVARKGGILLAFNHVSFLDPILLELVLPRPVYFLAKREVLGNRLTALLLVRIFGHIPIYTDRTNEYALERATAALAEGKAIALAPEGTRSHDGKLGPGKTGVAVLAYRTGCPVYPVGIRGTDSAWPRSRILPRPLRRTSVSVGAPITVPADADAANDPRRLRELTDQIMLAVAQLTSEAGV